MIRRFLKYIVVFVLFVVATLNLSAQSGLNVKAPSSAYINEGFTVSYTIQCSGRPSNFDKPTVSGGRIISGPYQSQQHSTTIINGQVSSSSSYTFSIMILATQEGTVKLSPAQVKADGKVYTSQAVSIRVSNSPSAHSNQRQQYQNQHNQRQQSYYNQYQQQQPLSSSQSNEINIDNSALFIRAIPNKSQVVRGEEIVISYKLYTLVPVSEYSIQTIPSTNGFWVEELDQQANPTLSIEEVNGQRYQVATLRKVIVYPQRTGRLTIPGLNVNILAHIATHSRQSFTTGDPFFDRFLSDPMFSRLATSYQKVQKDLKTNAITIQVNELPQPQPKDYCGGVGNFEITSQTTTQKIKAFDAFYLTYTLKGKGNLTLINSLPLNLPDEFQVSDPEITDNINRTSEGMYGSRTFKYLIIPSVEGDFKIPELSLSYYDITTNEYKTISSDGYQIHVDKGDASDGYAKQLDQRAKYRNMDIKTIESHSKTVHIFDEVLIYILPFLIFIITAVVIAIRTRHSDSEYILSTTISRAQKVAVKRLRKAKRLLNKQDYEAFEDEIAYSLWVYLLDRFQIKKKDFSIESLKTKLVGEQISTETVEQLANVFERCDYLRFSQDDKAIANESLYNDTVNVITAMEKEMKEIQKSNKSSKAKILSLLLILLLPLCSTSAQTLQEAEKQYNQKNYTESLAMYQKIAKQEPSTNAYCGVAASYFRLSDYANAMLYYEKALKLAPQDKNIQLNINIVRSRLMGDCYIMPEFLPIKIAKYIAGQFSIYIWAILFIVLIVVACVAFFFYRFTERKVLYFYVSLCALILSLCSMGFGICRQNIQNDTDNAIIMSAGIKLKPSRSATGKDIMQLYKGQKIRIIEDDGTRWIKVRTEDHREGFIENKNYARI